MWIVTETNRYVKENISELQISTVSIWNKWTDICARAMETFLGIIINMGLIMPDVKDYWTGEWMTQNPLVTSHQGKGSVSTDI